MASQEPLARPTQFDGLGYYKWGDNWQFCQLPYDGNGGIGRWYPTKELLLADAHRFAVERGFAEGPACRDCAAHQARVAELTSMLETIRTQASAVLGDR